MEKKLEKLQIFRFHFFQFSGKTVLNGAGRYVVNFFGTIAVRGGTQMRVSRCLETDIQHHSTARTLGVGLAPVSRRVQKLTELDCRSTMRIRGPGSDADSRSTLWEYYPESVGPPYLSARVKLYPVVSYST